MHLSEDRRRTRLRSLWGWCDLSHIDEIAHRLSGSRVLDIGCGYGSTVNHLRFKGFDIIGIDKDPQVVEAAQKWHPAANVMVEDAESLSSFGDREFDSVILRDSLHHLVKECDGDRVFSQIIRVLKPGGRIVVFDPNPTFIVKAARCIARHRDPSVTSQEAIVLLKRFGFRINAISYYEVFGLALSGGYVGMRFAPNFRWLNVCIATMNHAASKLLGKMFLGRLLCWRWIIDADLLPTDPQNINP